MGDYGDRNQDYRWELNEQEERNLVSEFASQIPQRYRDYHAKSYGHCQKSLDPARYMVQRLLCWCFAAMCKLSHRSWFERTWTYQEFALAKNVELICGGHRVSWRVINSNFKRLPYNSGVAHGSSIEELNVTKFFTVPAIASFGRMLAAPSFSCLLSARRQCKCHDPRDKVIALLGVAENFLPLGAAKIGGLYPPLHSAQLH